MLHRFSLPPLLLFCLTTLALTGCESWFQAEPPHLRLKPATFTDLPGWQQDNLAAFAPAFQRSCERMSRKPMEARLGALPEAGTYQDWQRACQAFLALSTHDQTSVRAWAEAYMTPFEVRSGQDPNGLFTGYYEASLNGSRTPHSPYLTPLHTRPEDLVMVNLGEFRSELKGQRIAGRVTEGMLRPYETREAIVTGHWPHQDKALVWVDDPVDAFFLQIQGSGVVQLDDGQQMRVGYDGQNGHPYFAIGRELIKRGAMTAETVSMQAIRAWLTQHPDQADEIMNTNPSYVFFREIKRDGAVGGEGVVLTPGRSLAIDHTQLAYGLPLWADIAPPVPSHPRLQRLMVAQDTGGAIRGAVRGDVFWGFGDEAEHLAGHMKSSGRYWVLLPRSLSAGKS
ncbi:MAG: murein transglycosylase A [Hahellaceae bacterium]|nr:murein transglycosylase A [Hahellaceae bacterium]